jgi:hypothetical protein
MGEKKKFLTLEEAKQIDMVDYLASIGFTPANVRGADYWYLSPLRSEHTASFKVNRTKNVWYDHGIGEGGTLIDFGLLFHQCNLRELLGKMAETNAPLHTAASVPTDDATTGQIEIILDRPLSSIYLLKYIRKRGIDESIAQKYCQEIVFELYGKRHTAIGFRNDKGGYELRSEHYKGSSSPKGITVIENGSESLSVFEGFFDFLAHQTENKSDDQKRESFLILNSTAFFQKSMSIMEQFSRVNLFLDRDETGQRFTQLALSSSSRYVDQSALYEGHKDLSEWLESKKRIKIKKRSFRQKP